MGIRLHHYIEAQVVDPIHFKDMIADIVSSNGDRIFILVHQHTEWGGWPQWLHQRSWPYFWSLVEGTGMGLAFTSCFSTGGEGYSVTLFLVDFKIVDREIMRLSFFPKAGPLDLSERPMLLDQMPTKFGPTSPAGTLNNDILNAVRSISTINSRGIELPRNHRLQLPKLDPTQRRPKYNKLHLLEMVKSATEMLMIAPFDRHSHARPFVRDGRSVIMEVRLVGHRSLAEVAATKLEWFATDRPAIDFPTFGDPDDERSAKGANVLMANMVHKDVSTLLRLLIVSCPGIAAISLAIHEHYAGAVRAVAHLCVGFSNLEGVDVRGMRDGVQAFCSQPFALISQRSARSSLNS